MKLKAIQLRKGNVVLVNNELCVITDVMHITPGKGQAVLQTKMKNIKTSNNVEKRYRPDESVEKIDLQTRKMEFLYDDGPDYYFMDKETYDQMDVHVRR